MRKFQLDRLLHVRIRIDLVKLVFRRIEDFKMQQRAVIKFDAKLKKITIETVDMLRTKYGEECSSRTSVFKWYKGSKTGESRYKTINGKTFLQVPEQKNRRDSFKRVSPKIERRVLGYHKK
jgi:hypothetical protein